MIEIKKPIIESRVYDSTSLAKGQRTFLTEKIVYTYKNIHISSCNKKEYINQSKVRL